MKIHTGPIVILLLILFLFPSPLRADLRLNVGVYQNEPLIFVDNDGKTRGIFADVLEYIASKEKWTIEYLPGSFQENLERLKSGEIDILCTIAYSEERDRWFDFTNEHLLTNWGQIYTPKNSDIRTVVDLNHKKVSVLQGDIHYSALKKIANEFRIKCNFIEVQSYSSVLNLIIQNEADAAVLNRFTAMKYGIKKDFSQSAIIFNPISIHYAVAEGKNKDLISAIDKHLISIKNDENSVYYQALDKWFSVASGKSFFPVWAKWFLLVLIGITLLLLFGNIILRFKVRQKTTELQKELTEREKAERALAERVRLLELGEAVIRVLITEGNLRVTLQQCTDALVKNLNASFARIWLLDHSENILVLKASSGLYTHIDGVHSRIPIGQLKIGIIAADRQPVLSNEVVGDPHIADQQWAKREGMVAFAGHPLIVENRIVGVIAIFSKRHLSAAAMKVLSSVSDQIALGIEHKQAEEALRESEEQYRDLFENADELIQSVRPDGRFLRVNKKWKKTLGYSNQDIRDLTVWEVIHPDAVPHCREVFSKIFSGEKIDVIETTLLAKDGTAIPAEGTVSCKYENEKPMSTRAIFRDITEKKRTEAEKAKLKAQIRKVQKLEAIGTLAGGVAHDFNNLLMTIQGNASLMLYDFEESHVHYNTLKDIENAVKSGAKLTRQLLGYARKGKYNVEPVNLNDIVEQTSETFGRTRKEITVRHQLQKDLLSIEADPGQMEQVLLNLYVNAADAMPGGGDLVLRTLNVTHEDMTGRLYKPTPGNYAKLTVADTGFGMDKNVQERIFDPFFTTKEMGRGTGLGLASVYGIVKGHGGYIDVESEIEQGTTFSIFLPASGKKIPNNINQSKPITEGSGNILIVDDEELVLKAGVQMLRKLGYTTIETGGGKEAIEIYKDNKDHVDLVILDMIMPEIGGGEAYDKMKEINPEVKVLLSSGYSIDGKASDILKRGCNGFIQKPFSMKELSEKITEIIET